MNSSNGNRIWVKQVTGNNTDITWSLATDSNGNIYAGGEFASTSISISGLTLNSTRPDTDGWMAKFNASGTQQWITGVNGEQYDNVYDITILPNDSIFITGTLSGDIGNTTVSLGTNNYNHTTSDAQNTYVAQMSPSGQALWLGESENDSGGAIGLGITSDGYDVYTYNFSNFSALPPVGLGNYHLAKIGQDFCPAVNPQIQISGSTDLCEGDSRVLSLPATYASYYWSTGENTETITVNAEDTYSVTVTNCTGCAGVSDEIEIRYTNLDFVPTATSSCGTGDGTATTNIVDGMPPYNYLWSDGQTTATAIGLNVGIYWVTVIDNCGDELIQSVEVESSTNSGGFNWEWAVDATQDNNLTGAATAVDVTGNIYVIGENSGFFSTGNIADFSNGINFTLHNDNSRFLVKYNDLGQAQWVREIAGINVSLRDVVTDNAGNVYIAGSLQNSAVFYGSDGATTNVTAVAGKKNIFIAKYNSAGNLLWVKRTSGNSQEEGNALATDGTNVYLTGFFGGTTSFPGLSSKTSQGQSDALIAKIDPNGTFLWLKTFGGSGLEEMRSITYDGSHVIVTGAFVSASLNIGGFTLTNPGASDIDIVLVKYDLNGNVVWAKSDGYDSNTLSMCLSSNKSTGDIYMTGFYLGNTTIGGTSINTANNGGSFITKYNSSGNNQWVKHSASSSDRVFTNNIVYDGVGRIYVEGRAISAGIIDFEGNQLATNSGELLMLAYDEVGTLEHLETVPGFIVGSGDFNNKARSRSNGAGKIYRTGGFKGNAAFGATVLSNSTNKYNLFLAELGGSDTAPCDNSSFQLETIGNINLCSQQDSVVLKGLMNGGTYLWSNGSTESTITVSQAGVYNVTITDCSGCTRASDPILVTNENMSIIKTTSAENCDDLDGYASIGITNGTSPYIVKWNNGANTAGISGLDKGIYGVTVTDANGCEVSDTITIGRVGQPPIVDFDYEIDNGTINLINNSIATTYYWDFGDGNSATGITPSHTYISSGIYYACIYGTNSCGTEEYCESIVVQIDNCLEVTNTNDAGSGSLRAAITCANSNPGPDTIRFNIGQLDTIKLEAGFPQLTDDGTVIDGYSQPSYTRGSINIDGQNTAIDGLSIHADNIEIYGLYIHNMQNAGIDFPLGSNTNNCKVEGCVISGNRNRSGIVVRDAQQLTISDCYVGLDNTGTVAYGNQKSGIWIGISNDINILNNVLSANTLTGLVITANTENVYVHNNLIGTDKTGEIAIGNIKYGIYLENGVAEIGGVNKGNVVSGNGYSGIHIGSTLAGKTINIKGNKIGTDINGMADLGNTKRGIYITNASEVIIGGNLSNEGNIISGNGMTGISVASLSSNLNIYGNLIGVNANQTAAISNDWGIYIDNTTNVNIGNGVGGANVISGNRSGGIRFGGGSSMTAIKGNFIGTNTAQTIDLGNATHGILFYNGSDGVIGGTNTGEGNIIANNGVWGIRLQANSINNTITRNAIFCNNTGGIDLLSNSNGNISSPDISSAITNTISGTGVPNSQIEIFLNVDGNCIGTPCQGKSFLGTTSTDSNGDWSFDGSFTTGNFITTTSTNSTGNTSRFSDCKLVEEASTNNCEGEMLVINNSIPTSIRMAEDSIISAGQIQASAIVEFISGEVIILKPGFHAQQGSDFIAKIEDCNSSNLQTEAAERINPDIAATNVKATLTFFIAPNPTTFNTTITYQNPTTSTVEIGVYNLNGQELKNVSLGEKVTGEHRYQLNTENLPSGIYFVQLITGEGRMKSQKMVVR